MTNNSYKLVSLARPCRICGRSSICYYSPDQKISICARRRENYDYEIDRSRWKVFVHVPGWKHKPPKQLVKLLRSQPPAVEKAPLVIRQLAYRTILELSPAKDIPELVEFLFSRGITKFENYGIMPRHREQRRAIAHEIRRRLQSSFPEFEDVWEMARIPGFWVSDEQPEFWYRTNITFDTLLIPYRDPDGKIKAMQTRSFFEDNQSVKTRYHWFSVQQLLSAGAGVTLHFAGRHFPNDPNDISGNKTIDASSTESISKDKNSNENKSRQDDGCPLLITEGALKADAVQELQNTHQILAKKVLPVANSGVGTAHDEIDSYCRDREVWLAFDQDWQINENVRNSIHKLLHRLEENRQETNEDINNIKVLTWEENVKGIDEALQKKAEFTLLSTNEWKKISVV